MQVGAELVEIPPLQGNVLQRWGLAKGDLERRQSSLLAEAHETPLLLPKAQDEHEEG